MNYITRTANSGSFRKGNIPYNKGIKGCSRKNHVRKGVQGFAKCPVLMINQDGSIRRSFDGVSECSAFLKVCRGSVTKACRGLYHCRGYKLMYEDDYSPFGDYSYRPTRDRNIDGSLVKGHHMSSIYNKRQSQETREKRKAMASELSRRMAHDPQSRWGKGIKKPVECLTTRKKFDSVQEAAKEYNLKPHQVSSSITRNGTCHGYKFITSIKQ